jgi:hypothetical protein
MVEGIFRIEEETFLEHIAVSVGWSPIVKKRLKDRLGETLAYGLA